MTLNEKIAQAQKTTEEIKVAHPEISSIWFEFNNIPVAEIQERAAELKRDYSIVYKDEKDRLQLNVSDINGTSSVIFAFSTPVKKTKPEFIIEA